MEPIVQKIIESMSTMQEECITIGIFGSSYAGKKTLAEGLVNKLKTNGITAKWVDSSQFMFGDSDAEVFNFSELSSILKSIKNGEKVYPEGVLQVFIVTGTYKYIPRHQELLEAIDRKIAIIFENERNRLERKLEIENRPRDEGGMGRSVEEVITEFTAEQFEERDSAMFVQEEVDILWQQDSTTVYTRRRTQ